MNQEIQQYVRIALYGIFWSLFGKYLSTDTIMAMVGLVGAALTLVWTIYGSRLNPLLERAKATSGVNAIEVKVDPAKIKPIDINQNTSAGITATRSASENPK